MVNVELCRAVALRREDTIGVAIIAVKVPILVDVLVLYTDFVDNGAFGVILALIAALIEVLCEDFTSDDHKIETEAGFIEVRVSFQVDRTFICIRDEVRAVEVRGIQHGEPL